ncbi:rod shape-determining protein MreD [Candidatus Pelagibacter sp.]|nr:rod shape-determining protein MreD [Candidatus Pelagibacter sp.]
MSIKFKSNFLDKFLLYLPLLLLFISIFNEFDFNYLNYKYFSFNFPFILIFYWSLKKIESLGYGFIFIAGLFNDSVLGFPIGISSLTYLIICGFAAYLRNITLRPNIVKDWFYFLFTILVASSINYFLLVSFFSIELNYYELTGNIVFTFLFYYIFGNIFDIYQRIVFRKKND